MARSNKNTGKGKGKGNKRGHGIKTVQEPGSMQQPPQTNKQGHVRIDQLGGVVIEAPIKLDMVQFSSRQRRKTEYEGLFDAMNKLAPGSALPVPVPTGDGINLRLFHNRLQVAITRAVKQQVLKPANGHRFRKGTSSDGKVILYLEKVPTAS